jgi:hypothetical protein
MITPGLMLPAIAGKPLKGLKEPASLNPPAKEL